MSRYWQTGQWQTNRESSKAPSVSRLMRLMSERQWPVTFAYATNYESDDDDDDLQCNLAFNCHNDIVSGWAAFTKIAKGTGFLCGLQEKRRQIGKRREVIYVKCCIIIYLNSHITRFCNAGYRLIAVFDTQVPWIVVFICSKSHNTKSALSVIVMSCIFRPCPFVPHYHFLHFSPLQFSLYVIGFSCK